MSLLELDLSPSNSRVKLSRVEPGLMTLYFLTLMFLLIFADMDKTATSLLLLSNVRANFNQFIFDCSILHPFLPMPLGVIARIAGNNSCIILFLLIMLILCI